MVHVVLSTAVALATGASLVAAGPCGYGALCGRSPCDAATVAAYQAALPQINACGATFDGYSPPTYPAIESEATLRRLCLTGACGAAFKTFVKFNDIETQVCELHYPTRLTNYLGFGGSGFTSSCLTNYSGVSAYPALDAEIKALMAQARGTAAVSPSPPATNAPATQSPATTKPPTLVPVTATPEPTTPSPTTPSTTPPPTTTSPATPEPTTETPSPSNTTTEGSREDITGTAEPQTADVTNSPTKLPAPPAAKTSVATSARCSASMLGVTALAAAHVTAVFVLA